MSQGGSPRTPLQLVSIPGCASLWTLSAMKSGSGLLLLSLEPAKVYEVCQFLFFIEPERTLVLNWIEYAQLWLFEVLTWS